MDWSWDGWRRERAGRGDRPGTREQDPSQPWREQRSGRGGYLGVQCRQGEPEPRPSASRAWAMARGERTATERLNRLEGAEGAVTMGRRPEQGKRMAMETREELSELEAARRPGSSSRPWKRKLGDRGAQGLHGAQMPGRAASLREAGERAGAGIEHGQELRHAFHGRSFGWALDSGKRGWEWLM
uniref:Uncharacterized protein n=1 Tax=Zea mays TaxID=4577 RepID=A0A804PC83_MAIZE